MFIVIISMLGGGALTLAALGLYKEWQSIDSRIANLGRHIDVIEKKLNQK